MASIIILFAVLALLVCALIFKLLSRSGGHTENADGLRIEQARRMQASADRTTYSAATVHNMPPSLRGGPKG
ncbi:MULTISPECIES: hypothetical protein [unclassified Streptomyces]|uniref:hypothetical protein n=1 Tax=unclassified Streptomyces TaxID=2593676 RepID=UPI000DB9705E|nr:MULTISPECIES: hypothetical protein [unclassified Streptomyces]MYT72244.1 hypothetical protein [Streptomyces sp. SID8367]RAJ81657.1 hypothetical protein K377_04676 [Streptomyces sp. PsTaAH-137]